MQTGGTGLGLNIARQIVVLHGGMIKVESDIDGTIFTIALPLEKTEKDKERLVNITEQVKNYSKMGSFIDTRTVEKVAREIQNSDKATQREKDYAENILKELAKQKKMGVVTDLL